MIIFDEQLQNADIITAVKKWYPGTVTHIRTLRVNSIIKDDNVPALLHAAQRPTFVTINVIDFWRKIQAHPGYCVIAIDLLQGSSLEIPIILRQVINHVAFKSRVSRMGKVIYIAARMLSDWQDFAAQHPTRIASLSLICPPYIEWQALEPVADRLYLIAGDQEPFRPQMAELMQQSPKTVYQVLPDVSTVLWTDVVQDYMNELQTTLLPFIAQCSGVSSPITTLKNGDRGEVAGITYTVYGAGEPLLLLPLILAPSGWTPLLDSLRKQFCTIVLGGPKLGALPVLEQRGYSVGYQRLIGNLFDVIQLQPGESILEVGSGSGIICRWLAQQTNGNNPITGVDINNYLLGEAQLLAEKEQVADKIFFCHGNAEALPFPDSHFDVTFSTTVMEEVNADKMLTEIIRVTKPGGRVGAIVRAEDLPFAINIPVRPDLRARFETPPPLDEGVACASASLYRRFHQSILTDISGWPQLVEFTKPTGTVEGLLMSPLLVEFTPAEREEWNNAIKQAVTNNTFFITWPHHCAVGTKPDTQ